MTITWQSIRERVLSDPKVKKEYDLLQEEFDNYKPALDDTFTWLKQLAKDALKENDNNRTR